MTAMKLNRKRGYPLGAPPGCEKAQTMIMDGVPSDPDPDNTLTGMQSNPVR